MSYAVRAYREAMDSGAIIPCGSPEKLEKLTRHIGNAGRHDLNIVDDEGRPLYVMRKIHRDRKIDLAMAGCLSWQARLDALRKNAKPTRRARHAPRRIY